MSLAEGVSPQEQADLLAQAMVTFLSVRERLKVEKAFWFCVKDWGGPGFGLLDVDGKPKPALRAYQAVTTELAGARYRGLWKTAAGVRGHVFDRAGQTVLVLWNPLPDGKSRIELKTSAPRLSLRAVTNQVAEVIPTGAKAAIDVSHAPVFLSGLKKSELEPLPGLPPIASPPLAARQRLPDVWVSVLPPSTTVRPYFVLGADNALPLHVHNDGNQAVHGRLELELANENRVLATGQVPFDSARGSARRFSGVRRFLPARSLPDNLPRFASAGWLARSRYRPSICRSDSCARRGLSLPPTVGSSDRISTRRKRPVVAIPSASERVGYRFDLGERGGATADQRGGQRRQAVEAAALQGR